MRVDYSKNVIGSILNSPSFLAECDLAPDEFGSEETNLVYQAILDVSNSNTPVDVVSVSDHLEKQTGKNYVMVVGLMLKDYGTANNLKTFANYVKQVRHNNQINRAIEIAGRLSEDAVKSGHEAIDAAIRDLMALNMSRKDFECGAVDAMKAALDHMDDVMHGKADPGIKTGIRRIDEYLGGLHNSDLIIVGARPAIGKTAFMLNLALSSGVPCGIISTEQPREQVGTRFMSTDARVPLRRMRNADIHDHEWGKMAHTIGKLKDRVIRINDKPNANINEIYRQARKWKQIYGIRILFVDYIQHIPGDRRLPRHEQVEEIVKDLKNIARELDIPVMALAQVNRKVEDRTDKRPGMSDLKDSGAIEQEADQIMLLYRDEVYNEDTQERGVMEVDIPKNRHGPTGLVKVAWIGEYVAIGDLDMRYQENAA